MIRIILPNGILLPIPSVSFSRIVGDEVRKIAITEWIPVSALEKVKIEVIQDETSDRIQPDLNGFCNWNLQLPPYSQAKVSLVYKIAVASDVEGLF